MALPFLVFEHPDDDSTRFAITGRYPYGDGMATALAVIGSGAVLTQDRAEQLRDWLLEHFPK